MRPPPKYVNTTHNLPLIKFQSKLTTKLQLFSTKTMNISDQFCHPNHNKIVLETSHKKKIRIYKTRAIQHSYN